ncbi:MAG: putative porin, partial [Bacteroidales bacterium]|nr:putative porin [Bacteroidales bacterium]
VLGVNTSRYYMFDPSYYLKGDDIKKDAGGFVEGNVQFPYRGFNASFIARIYSGGIKSGDSYFAGDITFDFSLFDYTWHTNAGLSFSSSSASYFESRFFSNRIKWNESLPRENKTSLSGVISSSDLGLSLEGYYNQIGNFISYDTLGVTTNDGQFAVFGLRAKKQFRLGGLRTDILVDFQQSTDESALSLPLLSTETKLYWEDDIYFKKTDGLLDYQIGVSLRYNTEYYADAYEPAMGVYVQQRIKKYGGYPWFDAFLNIKVKRMVIYLKYTHLNESFSNGEYFRTPYYPAAPAALTYGFIWRFYN